MANNFTTERSGWGFHGAGNAWLWERDFASKLEPGRAARTVRYCPSLNVAPPFWRLFAGWKLALRPKLGQHEPFLSMSRRGLKM
jgi:hypothetical protein